MNHTEESTFYAIITEIKRVSGVDRIEEIEEIRGLRNPLEVVRNMYSTTCRVYNKAPIERLIGDEMVEKIANDEKFSD
jgi:hypothetical protein